MQLEIKEIERIIAMSLTEDIGAVDVTSSITIPKNSQARFFIKARQRMVVCGTQVAALVFSKVNGIGEVATEIKLPDGKIADAGDILIAGHGDACKVMAAERVALNLLRQMCGVATITSQYVEAIKGCKAKLLDTRKTIPGLRSLQKYSVRIGGGQNHRIGLYDGILIKDNHIAICGSVANALKSARKNAPSGMKIEIECDTITQLKEALQFGADMVLLDNMSVMQLNEAVKIVGGAIPIEASGGVNLETIRDIAQTGVDFISVGSLTNTPANVDIGLDME